MSSAALRRCLEELDVDAMLRLHGEVFPHLPKPTSREQTLVSMHHARTQTKTIHNRLRYYSHRWLVDQGYPSGLPDALKPLAERMYPRVVYGVGIALKSSSELFKPILGEVRAAMESAVLEADGDGKITDNVHVKTRMLEAKTAAVRKLIGR